MTLIFLAMKDVPISNISSIIPREEFMTRRRKVRAMILFILANLAILFSLVQGPSFFHLEQLRFDSSAGGSNVRKFNFHFGPFNILNDFVTLDFVLLRMNTSSNLVVPIDSSIVAKSKMDTQENEIYYDNHHEVIVKFTENSGVSERNRIYARGLVNFSLLDVQITFRFGGKQTYPGIFYFTYADSLHSALDFLLRILIFFSACFTLLYFRKIDWSGIPNSFNMRILQAVTVLMALASNPFVCISYLINSVFLSIFDAISAIVYCVAAITAVVLLMDSASRSSDTLNAGFIISNSIPFVITGFFFLLDELFAHMQQFSTYQKRSPSTAIIISYVKAFVAAVCFIRILVTLIGFKQKTEKVKLCLLLMITCTFVVSMTAELLTYNEPNLSSGHNVQTDTIASLSLLVMYMMYLEWPIDIEEEYNSDDINNAPEGEIKL